MPIFIAYCIVLLFPILGLSCAAVELDPVVQRRLAHERARVRDAIRQQAQLHHPKKRPAKKSTPNKGRTTSKTVRKKAAPKRPRRRPVKTTPQKRPLSWYARINQLVQQARRSASVGVKIISLTTGKTLYERNATQLFKPASNIKVITGAAALHYLGPEFRYTTTLYTTKKAGATIHTLYLKGRGDPSLKDGALKGMIKQLKQQGITTVQGPLVVDTGYFEGAGTGPGWRLAEADYAGFDKSPTSALMINHSCITVKVAPSKIGNHPQVSVSPPCSWCPIVNHARTTTHATGRPLKVLRGQDNAILVRGALPISSPVKKVRISLEKPYLYAGEQLKALLKKEGIHCTGPVIVGTVPSSARTLAEHQSKPLTSLVAYMMKNSDNVHADAFFRTIGAHVYGAPGTWEKGSKAVRKFLKEVVHTPTDGLKIKDGCGLSHGNKIRPQTLCDVLSWEYHHSPYAQEFKNALSIGGVDGTLRQRFTDPETKRSILGKSGIIAGVTALSGYSMPPKKDPLVFAIMVNRPHASARSFKGTLENELCKVLVRYIPEPHPPHSSPKKPIERTRSS